MKKLLMFIVLVLGGSGVYWLFRNKERLEAQAHGLDDELLGKAEQVKVSLNGDTKTKLRGNWREGRGHVKQQLSRWQAAQQ
ncbi:CsbD family protein [Lactobacillus sp. CBA3606]|uniref:CsbD family protein n=1 Tax=Lactobacillus sp. CBA3606 TaxID=2099789 RepID=UPI000CFDB1AE|nr:CsbD family protein [Lactobacillus sp. CBA3606]AVK62764.1 CsbD family protein [Lactobacillus sp. CBA3606]